MKLNIIKIKYIRKFQNQFFDTSIKFNTVLYNRSVNNIQAIQPLNNKETVPDIN